MKKFLVLILAATMLLTLTSCINRTKIDSVSMSVEELLEFIEQFPVEEIPLPDGSTLSKNEAVDGRNNSLSQVLYFDFGVVRYAEPIFEEIEWEIDSSSDYLSDKYGIIENPECIIVKAGDVLENGMTVVSARSSYTYYDDGLSDGRFDCTELELSGEAELWGVLTVAKEDWEYGFQDKGDLLFFPDGSKSRNPLFYSDGVYVNNYYTNDSENTVIVYDGEPLFLGNVKDYGGDFSNAFSDKNYIKVKVTIKNLHLKGNITNGGTAEIIEWELL